LEKRSFVGNDKLAALGDYFIIFCGIKERMENKIALRRLGIILFTFLYI